MIDITVAICTYNRKKYLQQTLDSLLLLQGGEVRYEIIVVDNCCTDGTPELLEAYSPRFAVPFRLLKEKRQGLSHARNKALEEARGEIIAFLDDDAQPCEVWLCKIHEAMTNVVPAPAVVGGKVTPVFDRPQPAWARGGKMDVFLFSAVDYGEQGRWLKPDEGPVGANIAYRRKVLRDYGISFDPRLGRIGKGLLGGEEGEVLRRLREKGCNAYYVPEAAVRHIMAGERLDYSEAKRRFYWLGRSHSFRTFLGKNYGFRDYLRSSLQFTGNYLRLLGRRYADDILQQKHGLWNQYRAGMALQGWCSCLRYALTRRKGNNVLQPMLEMATRREEK